MPPVSRFNDSLSVVADYCSKIALSQFFTKSGIAEANNFDNCATVLLVIFVMLLILEDLIFIADKHNEYEEMLDDIEWLNALIYQFSCLVLAWFCILSFALNVSALIMANNIPYIPRVPGFWPAVTVQFLTRYNSNLMTMLFDYALYGLLFKNIEELEMLVNSEDSDDSDDSEDSEDSEDSDSETDDDYDDEKLE